MTELPPLSLPPPWISPAERYDAARDRLARTAARLALAELQAAGVVFRLDRGTLRAGPPTLVVNGTRQKIEQWREWLIVLVKETTT